jgi:hypothetical protein
MMRLTTKTFDGGAGCILSEGEQYRYRLWREWIAAAGPGLHQAQLIARKAAWGLGGGYPGKLQGGPFLQAAGWCVAIAMPPR